MITVSILINGHPLLTRSAIRSAPGKYRVDDGSILHHDHKEGAVALAHKLLDTITAEGFTGAAQAADGPHTHRQRGRRAEKTDPFRTDHE